MKKLPRQTALSVAQILSHLKGNQQIYPNCLLINELGAACNNGEDTDGVGEQKLISTLGVRNRHERMIAFCCLSIIDKEKYADVLTDFSDQTRNKTLLPTINQRLKIFNPQ